MRSTLSTSTSLFNQILFIVKKLVLVPNSPLRKLAELSNSSDATVLNAILYSSSASKTSDQSGEVLDEIRKIRKKFELENKISLSKRRRSSAFDREFLERLKEAYPEMFSEDETITGSSIGLGNRQTSF